MTPRLLDVIAVDDLRRIALAFDEQSAARKSAALARCASRAIEDPIALVASDESSLALLDRASAGRRGTRLAWLVAAFERLRCDDALRAHLFDTLQPFIAIEPADSNLSRTFVRGLPAPTFYHRDGLVR